MCLSRPQRISPGLGTVQALNSHKKLEATISAVTALQSAVEKIIGVKRQSVLGCPGDGYLGQDILLQEVWRVAQEFALQQASPTQMTPLAAWVVGPGWAGGHQIPPTVLPTGKMIIPIEKSKLRLQRGGVNYQRPCIFMHSQEIQVFIGHLLCAKTGFCSVHCVMGGSRKCQPLGCPLHLLLASCLPHQLVSMATVSGYLLRTPEGGHHNGRWGWCEGGFKSRSPSHHPYYWALNPLVLVKRCP